MSIAKNHLIDILADACAGMPCMCREAMFLDKQPSLCDDFVADLWPEPCALCAGILQPETYREYCVMRMIESHVVMSGGSVFYNSREIMRMYSVWVKKSFLARVYCCDNAVHVDAYNVVDYAQTGIEAAVVGAIVKKNGARVPLTTRTVSCYTCQQILDLASSTMDMYTTRYMFADRAELVGPFRSLATADMVEVRKKLGVVLRKEMVAGMTHRQAYISILFAPVNSGHSLAIPHTIAGSDQKTMQLKEKLRFIVHRFMVPLLYSATDAFAAWHEVYAKDCVDTKMYVLPCPDDINRLYVRFWSSETTMLLQQTHQGREVIALMDDVISHVSATAWRVARNHIPAPTWYAYILRYITHTINNPPPRDAIAK